MSRRCHTKTEGLSGAPLFGPTRKDIGEITNACSTPKVCRSVMARIEPSDGCWLWTGGTVGRGYGGFSHRIDGEVCTHIVHRLVYELLVGPIPDGLTIDHLCGVLRCVNPRHLEPVTQAENNRRAREVYGVTGAPARRAEQTHCIHGHEFTPENTRIQRNGTRCCITCARARSAEYRARKAAA